MKETSANPGISELCRRDKLIREFAKSMPCRLGEDSEQRVKDMDNVRTKVRTVGRLLKELQIQGEQPLPLEHFISGSKFNQVVNATIAISKQSNSPQIALVLGHYVKHLALLKVSMSIQNAQKEDANEARDFQKLYQAHWNNRVSSVAKRRQKLRHLNQPTRMPLSEDFTTLKEWLCGEMIEGLQNDQH
jgi:hypothetical protein